MSGSALTLSTGSPIIRFVHAENQPESLHAADCLHQKPEQNL